MYLVTADEMRQMDRKAIESFGIPSRVLMENAGREAARILFKTFDGLSGKRVGIVAGRGNNGGDGFVIARYLACKGTAVTVYLLAKSTLVKGDAATNLKLLAPLKIPVVEAPDQKSFLEHKTSMKHIEIWVDAIFGTGLKSDVEGYFKEVIQFINSLNRPVFAVDIPSGLNSDNGQPCGVSIHAHTTVTFAFAKTGHFLLPGADYTGNLKLVDIGIPPYIAEEVRPLQYLLTQDTIRAHFQPRPADVHKGSMGHLLIIAGSAGKTGAAAMTAISAMRAGAGLVTVGIPKSSNPVLETLALEVMTCPLPETGDGMLDESSLDTIMDILKGKRCLAIGPGLGTDAGTKTLVRLVIQECTAPLVIDADGLNSLAGSTQILKNLKVPAVLTPHPGEMARLTGTTASSVQKARIDSARSFAEKFNVHVVLKGARTVIAHPDGKVFINPTGNPGMASGGMGDVLTGIIAALITQGYTPEAATHAGVYLHGAAADAMSKKSGAFGFLATEVMEAIPVQIGRLIDGRMLQAQDNNRFH